MDTYTTSTITQSNHNQCVKCRAFYYGYVEWTYFKGHNCPYCERCMAKGVSIPAWPPGQGGD